MSISQLALILSRKLLLKPSEAFCRSWRILNEYPQALREAMLSWAQDADVPHTEISGFDLKRVMDQSGLSAPDALEIMYVMSRSLNDGVGILARCTPRDGAR